MDSTFSKCANPNCGASFDYRQGQLFRFHDSHTGRKTAGCAYTVRHLWLCKACSEIYTLVYREDLGVVFDHRFKPLSDKHAHRVIVSA